MTPADILALIDVLDDVGEESDALGVEEAVEMRAAVAALKQKANDVLGLIDSQLVATLESPREFNGKTYEVRPDGKWRRIPGKVEANVKRWSLVDLETGELFDAEQAVERCMEIMAALYLAPSDFPKTGGLDSLGLDKSDVGHYERAGKRIRVTDV